MAKAEFDQEAAFNAVLEKNNTNDAEEADSSTETKQPRRGRPKSNVLKDKHALYMNLNEKLYEDLKKIAYVDRRSISGIISDLIEEYIASKADTLEEYERITSD